MRAKLGRDFGVAVFVLEFVRDLKGAEGLDLILRRAVPDAVGAAEDVLLADMFHQLADDVGGAVGVAHVVAPGAAEFGIDVGVARHAVVLDRADQRVDAFAARWIVRALGLAGNEARVIDEKVYVRVALGDDANIARQAVLVGAPAERQAFVDADVAHAEGAGPLDQKDAGVFFAQEKAAPVRAWV